MLIPLRQIVFAAISLTLASCADHSPAPVAPVEKPAKPEKPPVLKRSERGQVRSISITETFELQQSGTALIYDARPSVHYNTGHIAGAVNMPKSICDEVIKVRQPELKAAVAANKTIIVYCTNPLCADARTVARHLAAQGYSSAVFHGGWDAWKAAGLPSE